MKKGINIFKVIFDLKNRAEKKKIEMEKKKEAEKEMTNWLEIWAN